MAATIRAVLVRNCRTWLQEKLSQDEYSRFLAGMEPELREFYTLAHITHSLQVPASTYSGTYDAFVSYFGPEAENEFAKMAAHVAINDMKTTMKIFMKLGSTSWVASKIPAVWHHYFSEGVLTITQRTDTLVVFELDAATKVYGPGACIGSMGWITEALTYSGGKNVKTTSTKCLHHGDDVCELKCTWK